MNLCLPGERVLWCTRERETLSCYVIPSPLLYGTFVYRGYGKSVSPYARGYFVWRDTLSPPLFEWYFGALGDGKSVSLYSEGALGHERERA